jgi:hypothetical protein
VWEPMITTDWTAPSGITMSRIADSRVRQFYDPKHLVSADLTRFAESDPARFNPDCCNNEGFYWDMAALYPAGTTWHEAPRASFANGPVYRIVRDLDSAILARSSTSIRP